MNFNGLVSPKSGKPLHEKDGFLHTFNRDEKFLIIDGIVNLLEPDHANTRRKHEMDVFNNLNIQNIPYFRPKLFQDVVRKIGSYLKAYADIPEKDFIIVEMGGGEGHWARFADEKFTAAKVYVCDLSIKTLKRAPKTLHRVCADVTRPIFQENSIKLAAFWVSLHHLEKDDAIKAFKEIWKSLNHEGVLIVFEPNKKFYPRQIMYRSRLSKDVYPDEKEQAVNFTDLSAIAENIGFKEIEICYLNPPYNSDFVKKLRRTHIYMPILEALYQIDKWVLTPIFGDLFSSKQCKFKKYFTMYGLAIFRKE